MTRLHHFLIATILAAFFWCFGAVLLLDRSFGFRDAANYYYPLFEWECMEWSAGRIPLWNPLDNGGSPVFADTTSSVLYPGKLIFTLPIEFRLRYHIYVTMHVLLAAGTAFLLARRWQCSVAASGLAAIAYAFGGSVLFQYCNVVFLVGGAWLPFAILAADKMLRERSFAWAIIFGATLALMVLGGDPQSAYHAGLLSALYAWLLRFDATTSTNDTSIAWRRTRPALLVTAAITGLCLALVQVLPAMQLTEQSGRNSTDVPRNVYEAIGSIASPNERESTHIARGLFETPQPGSHQRHIYEFSVGPWHLVEFVWPNIFGRTFPKNTRWSTTIPAEGRTWSPSLYLGLLPFLLALCRWRLRGCDTRIRFASLLTLLALLGSFGWYGAGWLYQELQASLIQASPDDMSIGPQVGGLYWALVTLLPGYVYFRYPAKLLVLASLGISLLAARGWDDLVVGKARRISVAFAVITAISLLAVAIFGVSQSHWTSWLADAPIDAIFGPLDVQAATTCVLSALLHTAVIGLAFWFVFRQTNERFIQSRAYILLCITSLELCVANGWMTLSIPGNILSEQHLAAKVISATNNSVVPARLMRETSSTLLPKQWSEGTDEHRLADVVAWERATLLPKHHLSANVNVIGSHTTLTSADWQSYLRLARECNQKRSADAYDKLLNLMSVQYVVSSKTNLASGYDKRKTQVNENVHLDETSRRFPRAWIVHSVEVIPPLRDRTRSNIDERTREVFFVNDHVRDFRSVAVFESNEVSPIANDVQHKPTSHSSCKLLHYSSQRIELETHLTKPGYLVLNDTYYPGWQAIRETNGETHKLQIHRANRLMRATFLPTGNHRIVYTFWPTRVIVGAAVSSCSWLFFAAYLAFQLKRWKANRLNQRAIDSSSPESLSAATK